MKTKKTITTIRTAMNEQGYADEARFCKEEFPQGGIGYTVTHWELWRDGHYTQRPLHPFERFRTAEEGNREYKRMIAEGYTFIEKDTFTTTEMDMR